MYNNITHNNINKDENYADEVAMWSNKFNDLMKHYWNAAAAIVKYYISDDGGIDTCPIGDAEFESIGKELRVNSAALIAAEETGLFVEGVGRIFYSALNNCGNWSYNRPIINYILKHDKLRKYVNFSDRYFAEILLSGGELLCDDEDLWGNFSEYAEGNLDDRQERGF